MIEFRYVDAPQDTNIASAPCFFHWPITLTGGSRSYNVITIPYDVVSVAEQHNNLAANGNKCQCQDTRTYFKNPVREIKR